jgi:excisionase family DNA binding protein
MIGIDTNNNTELPELMTVQELIDYFHCSKNKAYELIKQKSFPSIHLGGRYYILKDKFVVWLNNQTRKCTYAN